MANAAKAYLKNLDGAPPDMGELARLGVPQDEAIALCEKYHRPPEPPKPVAVAPAPQPAPVAPRGICINPVPIGYAPRAIPATMPPERESLPRMAAISMLHSLAQQWDSERADIAALVSDGWSRALAEEFAFIISQLKN